MNNRWKMRGLALMAALALALPALGAAEEPLPAEAFEDVITAEAVDSAEALSELDLGDDGGEIAWVEEPAPDAQWLIDAEPAPEIGEYEEEAPRPEPEEPVQEEPVQEETSAPDEEAEPQAPVPDEAPAPDDEAAPDEAPNAEGADGEVVVLEARSPAVSAKVMAAATALSLPAKTLTLGKGETRSFAAQLNNGDTSARITYTSSKPKVVQVDAAGRLRALKKGSATVTAQSGSLRASCAVKVVKAPSRVKLSAKKLVLGLEETRTLKVKLPKKSASAISWKSADPAVVTVDSAGRLKGVSAGTAKVTATAFNGKKAVCTVRVLNGKRPTGLSLPAKTVKLGLKEQYKIAPVLGAGEAALYTFSSSSKRIASVSKAGVVTARKKGTAKITVKTHTGKKVRLTVKVYKAPGKVTLSKATLSLEQGATSTLKATLPSGTGSTLTWVSADPRIATVSASGVVKGVAVGTTQVTVKTFNGKSASCKVNVTPMNEKNIPPNLTVAEMVANLRASSSLGSKKDAIANVAETLMKAGFEAPFAAGVCANVYSEGTYGFLESSKYVSNYQKRPKYFCYLDGGDYYTKQSNGQYKLTAVYLSAEEIKKYTGSVEARQRYGAEKYYWNNWSGKYVYNLDLNALQAFIDKLTAEGWVGKFGMGVTQWTGGRTRKLMARYRKYAGAGSATITKQQVIAAENEMILYDLQGDYKKVYTEWKSTNKNGLYCPESARSAGSLVCLKYEIPANKEQSAVTRGDRAAKFYKIMIGAN